MMIKIIILFALAQLSFSFSVHSQNGNDIEPKNGVLESKSQAERDWIGVDTIKTYYFKSLGERDSYKNSTFLEKRQFDDVVAKKKLRLVKDFLENHPSDEHYFEVLKFYFHPFFEPMFISDKIPDSTRAFLSQDLQLTQRNNDFFMQQMRTLPIDELAREQWMKAGNDLANMFLQSDAPKEQKAVIEMRLMGRDFRLAFFRYEYMNLKKSQLESSYWNDFDFHYWKPFLKRVQDLLFKYKELESMASFVQKFIASVTSNSPSSVLKEMYWKFFLHITDPNSEFAKHNAIKAVHAMAIENLKALEGLNNEIVTRPLEMEFTAMDGTKIDLKTLRDKVVLIDFWSIRCAPCIKEMPHVRALYDKYRKDGFEVIGIAAEGEANKDQVLSILERQHVNWPQRLDTGSEATVSYHELFKISSLPTVWLLDKNGIVVDKNARGEHLEPLIRKYLKLDE